MMKTVILICTSVALALSAGTAGATTYTVIDLGTLGGQHSMALGINESGQVTGEAEPPPVSRARAFVWDSGVMTELELRPGDDHSRGMAINASGQVAGFSGYEIIDPWTYEVVPYNTAVLWTGGVVQTLGTLGGTTSEAWGLNDSGTVVGWSRTASGAIHPFVWDSGVMTDIGVFGGYYGYAWGVNESGQVAGSSSDNDNQVRPFIWNSGVMTDLGTLGGPQGEGYGLNDSGQVVGWADNADSDAHAFLWDSGVMTDLGTLDSYYSIAYGVNNVGQVVGYAGTATGTAAGFVWEDGVMYDLNTLTVGASPWQIQYALSINDSGQIAAYGTNGSVYHGLLLNPVNAVPAPGAGLLVLLGTGFVGAMRKLGISHYRR